jgi:hypothetical protein
MLGGEVLVLERLAVRHCASEDEFDWLVDEMDKHFPFRNGDCWVMRRQPIVGSIFPIQWKPFFSSGKKITVTRY